MNWRTVNLVLALLFWGWWADFMLLAIMFAVVLAIAPRLSFRLQLDDRHFNRIVDLTSIVVAVVGLYLMFNAGRQGFFTLLAWTPVMLFPLLASQQYSTAGSISLSSLVLAMRNQQKTPDGDRISRIDLAWSYMALCVLAASVQVVSHPWFFPTLIILVAIALFSSRPVRYHWAVWMIVIALGAGLGYAGQFGLRTLHRHVEEMSLALLDVWLSKERDISHTSTAIGFIGELKASSRIVWQMRTEKPGTIPKLLRQASYQTYKYGSWRADKGEMTALKPEMEFRRWKTLLPPVPGGEKIKLSGDLGSGVLPVPMGVYRIDELPAVTVRLSDLGAVVVEDGPGFADFTLHYTGQSMDAGPDERDLEIPKSLQPTMQQLVKDLGLDPARPHESLGRIEKFFRDNFAYSLYLRGTEGDQVPLRTFLLQQRKGHCEYFATAGVMLLRAAGIPARYASGYAVNEYNQITDSWLIRKRHAHAWSLAFVDGAWRDLDYTPSIWAELESETTAWWVGMTDLWTIFRHSMQTKDNESDWKSSIVIWFLSIVLLLIAIRWFYRQKLTRVDHVTTDKQLSRRYQGMDSPFFEIQKHLKAAGYGPDKNETLKQWTWRIGLIKERDFDVPALNHMLGLHYRYRFGSTTEGETLKAELEVLVERWRRQQELLHG